MIAYDKETSNVSVKALWFMVVAAQYLPGSMEGITLARSFRKQ